MRVESSVKPLKLRVDIRVVNTGFDLSDYIKGKEYLEVQEYKKDKKIVSVKEYPFLLVEFNGSDLKARDILIKIKLEINASDVLRFEINQVIPKNILLLSLSGFEKLLVSIEDVKFKIDGKEYQEVSTNAPILYDKTVFDDIGKDKSQIESYYSLSNYLEGSFYYRGILLKLAFKNLDEITMDRFFIFNGEKQDFSSDNDLNLFKSLIQIDIISKIMLYIEDLIILMESNRLNKNFYELLDVANEKEVDVGQRLGDFFKSFETIDTSDWKKMLCYIESHETGCTPIVDIVLEKNISAIKGILRDIDSFGKSHHRIFRRYKHAGFPIRYAGRIDLSKYFTLKSDFSSGLFVGKNMLTDFVFLPFSDEVIESYKILIPALQILLKHVVSQRLDCFARGVKGSVPSSTFISPYELQEYENEYTDALQKFQTAHPQKFFDAHVTSVANDKYLREMTWYTEFSNNMERWRQHKENLQRFKNENTQGLST
jgi:hypothetical protein